jgi:hypothetical protein
MGATRTVRVADVAILLGLALALSGINLGTGFSGDLDGHAIRYWALVSPRAGYHPSRMWGYPAYEALAYPLIVHFGVGWAQGWSLACAAAGVLLLHAALRRLGADRPTALVATACWVVLPVVVISGDTVMETSQGTMLALLALYLYVRLRAAPPPGRPWLLAAALGLATATRLDYALLSAAVALTVLRFHRPRPSEAVGAALVWTALALGPFAIYGALPASPGGVASDPLAERLARAALGALALLGVPAWALLVWWAVEARRSLRRRLTALVRDDLGFLLATAIGLYAVRFALLPDELEYLLVLVPLLLVVLVQAGLGARRLFALALALALPNVLQLHLLRMDADGGLAVDVGLSPGAIVQDRSVRTRLDYLDGELATQLAAIAHRHGQLTWAVSPSTEPGAVVVIPRQQLRFYRPDRHGGEYWRAVCDQTLVVYPMPSSKGWRQFIAFEPWRPVAPAEFTEVHLPHCGPRPALVPPPSGRPSTAGASGDAGTVTRP